MVKLKILEKEALVIALKKLAIQKKENEKLTAALIIAKKELSFQHLEKGKRAKELGIANKELIFQGEEKGKRAAELNIANIELDYQNKEKGKRAAELNIANIELDYQNKEKGKRAAELNIANIELDYQNNEKGKRAAELNIANKELVYQNKEKGKRAAELNIANIELVYQNKEKGKRAAELNIANIELVYQNQEKAKKEDEKKELELFSHSIKLASQYTRSLIEASQDPLFVINTAGKISDMNQATVGILCLSRKKLLGSHFSKYFSDKEKVKLLYEDIFIKGFIADNSLKFIVGKLSDVLFNGSVFKDDDGNILGAVLIARDTSEQKRIETELIESKVFAELATSLAEDAKTKAENATLIAERAVKTKQQFLSNMSHEIRTPMNAIIGFTKVVLKTELTAQQKEYLTAIKLSGDALIVLINDILDLAKVDSGKLSFEHIPFNIALSVPAMLHLFETKIEEKNLKLVKEYDKNIPQVLVGDPVRLQQIILNLVGNAVKFTKNGKITVSVKLLSEDKDFATIEFAITDTGIGIAENKIGSIFESFQQASSGTSRLYGGSGLGLAIVKQLLEQQGSKINVKSKIGEGSTFSFTLTFQKSKNKIDPQRELLELNSEIKNIKVLVVEDIALNQLLMKTLLDDFGFERDIADNGKIAIEKMKTKKYDIILMDLQMPEMNGFEATEYIRNKMKLKIPIIALTADVTTVDLAKCKAVGMDDYIAKPVDERVLYSKIISQLKKSSSKNQVNGFKTNTVNTVSAINLDYLNRRTKSNPVLMLEMIALYLEQTPPLITAMRQSFLNKDWNKLYAAVHKMIPSFSIMGINAEFETMAIKIQDFAKDQQQAYEIPDMVSQLGTICEQACIELIKVYNQIKKLNP